MQERAGAPRPPLWYARVINVGQPASVMLPKAVPIVIGWSTTSTDPLLDVDLFVQLLGP